MQILIVPSWQRWANIVPVWQKDVKYCSILTKAWQVLFHLDQNLEQIDQAWQNADTYCSILTKKSTHCSSLTKNSIKTWKRILRSCRGWEILLHMWRDTWRDTWRSSFVSTMFRESDSPRGIWLQLWPFTGAGVLYIVQGSEFSPLGKRGNRFRLFFSFTT